MIASTMRGRLIRSLNASVRCTIPRTKLLPSVSMNVRKSLFTTTRRTGALPSGSGRRASSPPSSPLSELYKQTSLETNTVGGASSARPSVATAAPSSLSQDMASIPSISRSEVPSIRDRTTGYADMVARTSQSAGLPSALMRISGPPPEPHHFHIYCTKHNTHITLTRPNREPILSFSSGNIGFRKAQRGTYDAGFQVAAYVMKMIQDRGLLRPRNFSAGEERTTGKGKGSERAIDALEVVVRGFGKGREAVVKALMGSEGRTLRKKVTKISDATRLKFGGTRSPAPRRLG